MQFFNIEFKVFCETKFGQNVHITGNLTHLGKWKHQSSLKLFTNQVIYPYWTSNQPLKVISNCTIHFKVCILDHDFKLIRWQDIQANRIFTPKDHLIVELKQSDPNIEFKPSVQLNTNFPPVRKDTQQLLKSLGSDSSSNRQLWNQHNSPQEQNVSFLTSFTLQIRKAAPKYHQLNSYLLGRQPQMQGINNYSQENYATNHFFICNNSTLRRQIIGGSKQKILNMIFLAQEQIKNVSIYQKEDVNILHILGTKSQEKKISVLAEAFQKNMQDRKYSLQYYVVCHLENGMKITQFNIFKKHVNFIVCNSVETLSQLIEFLESQKLKVNIQGKDLFSVRISDVHEISIIFFKARYEKITQTNQVSEISELSQIILKKRHFLPNLNQFEDKMLKDNTLCHMKKTLSCIILKIDKFIDLDTKVFTTLTSLSSRTQCMIFVILNQTFDEYELKRKFPISEKDKIIFINLKGQIYSNQDKIESVFNHIDINRQKFSQNKKSIIQEIGCNNHLESIDGRVLNFPKNSLGKLLKQRAIHVIKDNNQKSTARIIFEQTQNSITMLPFCLHPSFIYQTIFKTYLAKLHKWQKGIMINIDGSDLSSLRHVDIIKKKQFYHQKEKIIDFNYCLRNDCLKMNGYICNPINEVNLLKFIEIIIQKIEEQSKIEPQKKQVLSQIKNLQ